MKGMYSIIFIIYIIPVFGGNMSQKMDTVPLGRDIKMAVLPEDVSPEKKISPKEKALSGGALERMLKGTIDPGQVKKGNEETPGEKEWTEAKKVMVLKLCPICPKINLVIFMDRPEKRGIHKEKKAVKMLPLLPDEKKEKWKEKEQDNVSEKERSFLQDTTYFFAIGAFVPIRDYGKRFASSVNYLLGVKAGRYAFWNIVPVLRVDYTHYYSKDRPNKVDSQMSLTRISAGASYEYETVSLPYVKRSLTVYGGLHGALTRITFKSDITVTTPEWVGTPSVNTGFYVPLWRDVALAFDGEYRYVFTKNIPLQGISYRMVFLYSL